MLNCLVWEIIIILASGTGESWLFSLDSQSGDFQVYKWTTANQLFIKVRKDISVLRKLSLIPSFPTTLLSLVLNFNWKFYKLNFLNNLRIVPVEFNFFGSVSMEAELLRPAQSSPFSLISFASPLHREAARILSSEQGAVSLDSGLTETSTKVGPRLARLSTILRSLLRATSWSTVSSAGPFCLPAEHDKVNRLQLYISRLIFYHF